MPSEKFLLWTVIILAVLLGLTVIHGYYRKHKDRKIKVDLGVKFHPIKMKSDEGYHGMDYENYAGAF